MASQKKSSWVKVAKQYAFHLLAALVLLSLSYPFYVYFDEGFLSDVPVLDGGLIPVNPSWKPQLVPSANVTIHSTVSTALNDSNTDKVTAERLRIREELHLRIAPINKEFVDDFGVSVSNAELQRRVGEMQSERWISLPYSSPPPKHSSNAASSGRRYLASKFNQGRTNNQLISFMAFVQYCIFYNRTLVVPLPRMKVQYMGFEHGLWDLQRLSQVVDVILETELPDDLRRQYMELKWNKDDRGFTNFTSRECQFHKGIGPKIPQQSLDSCELIWLTGARLSIIHWDSGWPSVGDVWKYMIPAPYIRNAVELFLMSAVFNSNRNHFGNGSNASNVSVAFGLMDSENENTMSEAQKRKFHQRRFVAVHRRAMVEYHSNNPSVSQHVCRRKRNSVVKSDRSKAFRSKVGAVIDELISRQNYTRGKNDSGNLLEHAFDSVLETHHYSCGMTLSDLNSILRFHREAAIGSANDVPFYIAHDSQQKAVVENMTANGKGVQQSNDFQTKWSLVDALKTQNRSYGYEQWLADCKLQYKPFCASEAQIKLKEEVLFDMWALYYADFFVGTWMSTLSDTVCKWRSRRLAQYRSNQCFLKPKWDQTMQSLRNDENITLQNMWFSLENVTFETRL